jgi:leukotriene-A4 hydrolase
MKESYLIGLFTLVFACQPTKEAMKTTVNDPHSYAQPDEAVITHLDWEADVDFDNHQINGLATFTILASERADEIIFDTKELQVQSVAVDGKDASFDIGEPNEHMGQSLSIGITPDTRKVSISYTTSPGAEALQWLNPQQTSDKKMPFLFTQSQAILARSWIPIQDSPGIRFTYNATVRVPEGMLALMSAKNPTTINETGAYKFKMDQPIPAYLMALAVGDIRFAPLGERSGVYAEPSMLEKAAYELADTEKMIKAAEKLYGPYQWGRYDLIVLPPSFPFGGMENPMLTFATPTILAGDRSLVSLVAHELAHSWSGNLVTNATWDDFWLNEGFTVYFEMRIMEELYGRPYSEMLSILSQQALQEEVASISISAYPQDTKLKLDLRGRNPDDGMTSIAYEKGYAFLRLLEETVGRETFDVFLKTYFTENAFKSMTTESFISYMEENLIEKNEIEITSDFYKEWIYTEGIPENVPRPVSSKFDEVSNVLAQWQVEKPIQELITKEDLADNTWNTHQWLHFLNNLPESMSNDQMKELDSHIGFTQSGNSEIIAAWMPHVIRNDYEPAYPKLEEFLVNVGRRKFLVPLYAEMIKTEKGKQMARDIYIKARPNYHFVSVSTLDKMLGWESEE